MRPIHRALLDPLLQGGDLRGASLAWLRPAAILRHQVVRVFRLDALDQFAPFGWPGTIASGWPGRFFIADSPGRAVSPALRISGSGPWQLKHAGQDRLHILIEINLPRALTTAPVLLPAVTAGHKGCSHKAQRDCQGSMSRF